MPEADVRMIAGLSRMHSFALQRRHAASRPWVVVDDPVISDIEKTPVNSSTVANEISVMHPRMRSCSGG